MRKITLLIIALLLAGVASAQVDRDEFNKRQQQMREQFEQKKNAANQRYDESRRKAEEEFAAFRKRANEEYAAAMQRAWTRMDVQPAEVKKEEPAPPMPPAPAPDKIPTTMQLPAAEVVPPLAKPKPLPAPPIPEPDEGTPTLQFAVYGAPCSVHTSNEELRFTLSSVDEKGVAEAWRKLSQEKYDGLLHDCLARRDEYHLDDWGYMRLLQSASEKLLGKGTNEAVLLQMYLLTQSGYRVRLAYADGHLMLLMPFNRTVFGYKSLYVDGIKHYLLTRTNVKSVYVSEVGFPHEQVASVQLSTLPLLESKPQPKRTFAAEHFGTLSASIGVNKSLIDYMSDYPPNDAWDGYVHVGLSNQVKDALYPVLSSQLEGKSNKKAVTMLLDFMHTAFEYVTDGEQFGYERPFFGDESFYYPQNDCEDRAILFSILVRDLLHLDVVLVYWTGHLATAVAFPEEVEGDYFVLDGRRYTVCDPTYEGAGVGMTMPDFQNKNAKLIKL